MLSGEGGKKAGPSPLAFQLSEEALALQRIEVCGVSRRQRMEFEDLWNPGGWLPVLPVGPSWPSVPALTFSQLCVCVCVCVCVLVAQSCPTLCDPIDCSPPGSSVHGILQARILEWIAMPFSSWGPSITLQLQNKEGRRKLPLLWVWKWGALGLNSG